MQSCSQLLARRTEGQGSGYQPALWRVAQENAHPLRTVCLFPVRASRAPRGPLALRQPELPSVLPPCPLPCSHQMSSWSVGPAWHQLSIPGAKSA